MIGMLLAAFGIGLIIAMPPGPVVISTGQRAIHAGFWHALVFNMGSILADTIYALLMYFGAAALLSNSMVFRLGLWILGGAWLMWMGWQTVRTRIDLDGLNEAGKVQSRWHNFRAGLMITLLNPLTIVSWLAVAGSFSSQWSVDWPPKDAVGILPVVAMLAGALAWVMLVALALSSTRRWISPRLVRWISIGSGVLLVIYGLGAWAAAAETLLGSGI